MAKSITIWIGFALLCAGAGCTSHVTAVRPLPPEKEAEINRMVDGREVRLIVDGNARDTKNVRLTGNTVRFAGPPGPSGWLPEAEAPLTSLQRIEYRDHGRGASRGFVFGALIGAAAGFALPFLISCPDCSGGPSAGAVAISGIVGTLGLGLIGTGIGAATGASMTIDLKDAPSR